MRRKPAVVLTRADGQTQTFVHGTMRKAQINASMIRCIWPDARAEWVAVPTLWDKLLRKAGGHA